MTYEEARTRFLILVTERCKAHYAMKLSNLVPPTYEVHEGRKYDKVVEVTYFMENRSRGSYCYINRSNGDILKGSWKGLDNPKVARGNIFGDDPLKGTNLYGVDYLKLDNSRYK
jgi:hypothetical protein